MAAGRKVFSTYELIERILLHLPLRDLLLAHRINKAASDVITRSGHIQQALFLTTSSSAERPHRILNPFLKVRRIGMGDIEQEVRQALHDEDAVLLTDGVLLTDSDRPISAFACWRLRPDLPHLLNAHDQMLFTQPPDRKMQPEDCKDDYRATVSKDEGISYGQLLDYGSTHWPVSLRNQLKEMQRSEIKKTDLKPAVYSVLQAVSWKRLKGNFDSITGYEMLEIMHRDDLKELGGKFEVDRDGGYESNDSDDGVDDEFMVGDEECLSDEDYAEGEEEDAEEEAGN